MFNDDHHLNYSGECPKVWNASVFNFSAKPKSRLQRYNYNEEAKLNEKDETDEIKNVGIEMMKSVTFSELSVPLHHTALNVNSLS